MTHQISREPGRFQHRSLREMHGVTPDMSLIQQQPPAPCNPTQPIHVADMTCLWFYLSYKMTITTTDGGLQDAQNSKMPNLYNSVESSRNHDAPVHSPDRHRCPLHVSSRLTHFQNIELPLAVPKEPGHHPNHPPLFICSTHRLDQRAGCTCDGPSTAAPPPRSQRQCQAMYVKSSDVCLVTQKAE